MASFKFLAPFLFFLILSISLPSPTLAASLSPQPSSNFTFPFKQTMIRQEIAQYLLGFNGDFTSGRLIGTAACLKRESIWFAGCYSRYPLAYTYDATTLNHTISYAEIQLETFCASFDQYVQCLEKIACEKCASGPVSTVPCHLKRSSQWNICEHPILIEGKWYVNFLTGLLIVALLCLLLLVFSTLYGFKFLWRHCCRCGRGGRASKTGEALEDQTSHSDLE